MLQFGDPLKLQATPEESLPPDIQMPIDPKTKKPISAGFQGQHQLLVKVVINFWGGKVTGVTPDIGGKFHRLEVVRMVALDKYDEDVDAWMRVRVGKKTDDTSLRPDMRTSLILRKAPGYGLANMKPWFQALSRVEAGMRWAAEEAKLHKTNQYALMMAISTGKFEYTEPKDARFEAYMAGEIVGIHQLEALKLEENPGLSPFDPVAMVPDEDDTNYGTDY
jgi:hypothetical protein